MACGVTDGVCKEGGMWSDRGYGGEGGMWSDRWYVQYRQDSFLQVCVYGNPASHTAASHVSKRQLPCHEVRGVVYHH